MDSENTSAETNSPTTTDAEVRKAVKRTSEFIRQRSIILGLDKVKIYTVHSDSNSSEATLTVRDIETLIRAAGHCATSGWKLVPKDPPEAMWSDLARDIIMGRDMECLTVAEMRKHLEHSGYAGLPPEIEAELKDYDKHLAKGDMCVLIYKAMLAACPTSPSGWPTIDSAPKDRRYLGVIKTPSGNFGEPFVCEYDEEDGHICQFRTDIAPHRPTHWTTLPRPPTEDN